MRREHRLKTWPSYFQAIVDGEKSFEIRQNDRGFRVGDVLVLEEYDVTRGAYTKRVQRVHVTYIFDGPSSEYFGLIAGFCIMGIELEDMWTRSLRIVCFFGALAWVSMFVVHVQEKTGIPPHIFGCEVVSVFAALVLGVCAWRWYR